MAELIKVNAPVRKPLFEGVQGENEARSIQFDIEPWVTELGDGAVTATAKRSQDSQPYPVTVTRNGTTVTWKPTSTDTAFAGVGSFQLEYTVDSVLAKTCIWSTMVAPSLDPAGDPPDPYDNWLADMRAIEASAIQSADDAQDSADAAAASAASIAGDHDELINIRIGADGTTYASAGDAVRGQIGDLNNICFNSVTSDVSIWKKGYWRIADGIESVNADDWLHSLKYFDDDIFVIYTTSDLNMFLQAWDKDDGTYVGTWNGSAFTNAYVADAGKRRISLSEFRNDYPLYNFTISLKAQDGRNLTPATDGATIMFCRSTINSDIEKLNGVSFKKYKMSEVYERKEVSNGYNMYERYTTENPTRARAKQDYIQEIPEGATYATVKISADSLANGKYKVGWAYYTDNFVQIRSTVMGWYTTDASFVSNVVADAKYFMLYYATNSAEEITLDEIDTAKNSIVFDNSPYNYAELMVNNPVVNELEIVEEEISNIENNLTIKADNETFIYSVNHRGYSTEAPENTLPAYILSKKKGFVYAECDVQFTSDGVAVLLHDSTINRTARNADGTEISSTVNIGDITYAQALEYDFGIWKGEKWAGTKIPTFDEFILLCKKLSLHPFIELKDSVNGTYWTDARADSIASSIKNVGMENHVTFISFAVSALQKMSVHFPNARLGLGFEGAYSEENFRAYVANAEALVSDDREVIATVSYSSMTDSLYSILTSAGIKPLVWTVNTQSAVLNLDETVVGVLSDYLNAGMIILDNLIKTI